MRSRVIVIVLLAIFALSGILYVFMPKQPTGTVQIDQPVADPNAPKVGNFSADTAFAYIEKQLAFGPRVPNTPAHKVTRDWLIQEFQRLGAKVTPQDFKATAYTGTELSGTNIIASYKPENPNRLILAAHWDSRHISDRDPDPANQKKGVPAADDGASGVAVLLEVARQLQANPIELGVDLILFDLEDYGDDNNETEEGAAFWCLGSQHWSRNPHASDYRARYGILLDMVGAKGAQFLKEGTSMRYAPDKMNKVWQLAQAMGYSSYFRNEPTGGIIDDHYFVNQIAQIPMIDIINRPGGTESGFGPHWHTQNDNISIIDKNTLKAVGQVVLAVLYQDNAGIF